VSAALAEEGEKLRSACAEQCKEECLSPNDCWQVEPEVASGNADTWSLFKLFETRWQWGAAGYRCGYDIAPLQAFAIHAKASPAELLDIVERVKVIEETVLVAEAKRAEMDEDQREAKAGGK
jgi:hypothetical protein